MMEFNLQIVLLIVGALIIAFVLWDSKRRKNADNEQEEVSQEELDDFYTQRDNSGYDVLGVGLSRVITDDESLVAKRDDQVNVTDERLTASRDDSQNNVDTATAQPDMIISFTVLAKDEHGFNGEKLLHCMLSRGLRFGDMEIFHRHKHTSGEGPIQFSLANALKPGTFNLDDMSSFKTRAVSLFLILPGPGEPINAYNLMLDTARHIATELDGQILDDHKSVLTQQTIQHFKEQIIDYERRHQG